MINIYGQTFLAFVFTWEPVWVYVDQMELSWFVYHQILCALYNLILKCRSIRKKYFPTAVTTVLTEKDLVGLLIFQFSTCGLFPLGGVPALHQINNKPYDKDIEFLSGLENRTNSVTLTEFRLVDNNDGAWFREKSFNMWKTSKNYVETSPGPSNFSEYNFVCIDDDVFLLGLPE